MNYNLIIKQSYIVLISCFLLACAASEETVQEDQSRSESRGSDCISQSTVRDYSVLDDSNLIVTASGRRKYHLGLDRRVFGLRSSWRIGFKTATGRICSGFSQLIVDDGFGPEKIRIRTVRRLTPEDEEELLIRFGKKEPENEQAPATESVESAEVEELD